MWNQSLGIIQNQNILANDYRNLAFNNQRMSQKNCTEMNA